MCTADQSAQRRWRKCDIAEGFPKLSVVLRANAFGRPTSNPPITHGWTCKGSQIIHSDLLVWQQTNSSRDMDSLLKTLFVWANFVECSPVGLSNQSTKNFHSFCFARSNSLGLCLIFQQMKIFSKASPSLSRCSLLQIIVLSSIQMH